MGPVPYYVTVLVLILLLTGNMIIDKIPGKLKLTKLKPNGRNQNCYRAAVWIEYYQLLPDIIRYFPYNFKIHEFLGGKNVWK